MDISTNCCSNCIPKVIRKKTSNDGISKVSKDSKVLQQIASKREGPVIMGLKIIAQTKDPQYVDIVIDKLHSSNTKIKCEAIRTLGEIGTSEHVSVLIPELEDARLIVRSQAEIAINKLASPSQKCLLAGQLNSSGMNYFA